MADTSNIGDSDQLAEVEALLRDLDVSDLELGEPPADVWAGIERALAEAPAAMSTPQDETQPVPAGPANVVSLADRRRMRLLGPAMAIAAAAVLTIAGVVIFSGGGSNGEVVASAVLEFDPAQFDPLGSSATAAVSLVDVDDHYEISIDEAELPEDLSEPADLEVWLIEADENGNVVDLVSLGIVENLRTPFVVPAGYDPAVYRVVDISVEPHDGNHDHSGRSILRGALTDV
jgi:hypothetical protein